MQLSYLLRRLAQFVGVHGQYGVPGTQEQHAWWGVQQEGTEVAHASELCWAQNLLVCGAKRIERGGEIYNIRRAVVLLSVIQNWFLKGALVPFTGNCALRIPKINTFSGSFACVDVRISVWQHEVKQTPYWIYSRKERRGDKAWKTDGNRREGERGERPWFHPALSHNHSHRSTPLIPLSLHHPFSLSSSQSHTLVKHQLHPVISLRHPPGCLSPAPSVLMFPYISWFRFKPTAEAGNNKLNYAYYMINNAFVFYTCVVRTIFVSLISKLSSESNPKAFGLFSSCCLFTRSLPPTVIIKYRTKHTSVCVCVQSCVCVCVCVCVHVCVRVCVHIAAAGKKEHSCVQNIHVRAYTGNPRVRARDSYNADLWWPSS